MKTYKLLIGGDFVRSESGRSYEVAATDGSFIANVAQGSRKDVRDAVAAARAAQTKWQNATAYNRGQVLYRLGEMAESRRDELVHQVVAAEGVGVGDAASLVSASIDLIIYYAGWTDKVAQVLGGSNPVAGPFFNFSVPTPTGVIGVLAPKASSLLGFVQTVLPPLCLGNTVVVAASEDRPIPGLLLGEMSATADFPGGVLNVLSGQLEDVAPTLSSHEDVDGLDLTGATGEEADEWAMAAAQSIKRVYRPRAGGEDASSLRRLRAFVETATVWHTIGQ
jgi:acyl-CoA reductase-like NAD-dependent aldehyde dehydrogenase